MKRRTAALLIAAAPFGAARPLRADDATVSVGITPVADAVPMYYAMSAGLFDRAGIKIDRQVLANGAAIAAAVAGGVVDVGFSNVQTLVLAHVKGIPFIILAAGGEYNDATPTTQLIVRSDATIKTAKDMEGKTVAVGALKDLQSLSTMAWMANNGADPTKVSFIETPASAAPALLAQKRADAINVSEPNLYNAISSGNARVLANAYSAIAKRLPVSAYFSNRSFPATRPDVAKKFIDVMRHASDYANTHPEEMDALIADYAKIPPGTLRAMNHAHQGTVVDTAGLQKIIDASATFHLIDKAFAASELVYG